MAQTPRKQKRTQAELEFCTKFCNSPNKRARKDAVCKGLRMDVLGSNLVKYYEGKIKAEDVLQNILKVSFQEE